MSLDYNNLRSTTVHGQFKNLDYADNSITASATFQRNVSIGGDLTISGTAVIPNYTNNSTLNSTFLKINDASSTYATITNLTTLSNNLSSNYPTNSTLSSTLSGFHSKSSFSIYTTGNQTGYIRIGIFQISDTANGQALHIKLILHNGFDSYTSDKYAQDSVFDIFFKFSNSPTIGNSWYYSVGNGSLNARWVVVSSGVVHLWVQGGYYLNNSYYEVSYTPGSTWENSPSLSSSFPSDSYIDVLYKQQFVSPSELTSTLASYPTNTSLVSSLGYYPTNDALALVLTSYATISSLSAYAKINNQTFTGSVSAPTVSDITNSSTLIATTAFVQNVLSPIKTTVSSNYNSLDTRITTNTTNIATNTTNIGTHTTQISSILSSINLLQTRGSIGFITTNNFVLTGPYAETYLVSGDVYYINTYPMPTTSYDGLRVSFKFMCSSAVSKITLICSYDGLSAHSATTFTIDGTPRTYFEFLNGYTCDLVNYNQTWYLLRAS
jgi:hypothetical protein